MGVKNNKMDTKKGGDLTDSKNDGKKIVDGENLTGAENNLGDDNKLQLDDADENNDGKQSNNKRDWNMKIKTISGAKTMVDVTEKDINHSKKLGDDLLLLSNQSCKTKVFNAGKFYIVFLAFILILTIVLSLQTR